jgi:hypothetical protein
MNKCEYCKQEIKEKEKYTLVGTYQKKSEEDMDIIEEKYFHLKCWKLYFNKCVSDKLETIKEKVMGSDGIKNIVESGQKMIKKITEQMQGAIDNE